MWQTREIKEYKKFVIEADPQRTGPKIWQPYIVISRERAGGPNLRPFEDDTTFDNRLDAIRFCFEFGKKIIDGEVEGMNVDDL